MIAIEKSTGIALYRGDVRLDPYLIGSDFMDSRMTAETCDLIDAAIPDWIGGGYTYADGLFAINAHGLAVQAEREKERQAAVASSITTATQTRLDDFAKTRGYDGILSACTYATSANPNFSTEGQYAVTVRDATWAKLYQIMQEVEAGTRPMPTSYGDVDPDLPTLEWPA